MKILIVSDTHRRDGNLRAIIEKQSPFDMLIHLGDTEGSESSQKKSAGCPINRSFLSEFKKKAEPSKQQLLPLRRLGKWLKRQASCKK